MAVTDVYLRRRAELPIFTIRLGRFELSLARRRPETGKPVIVGGARVGTLFADGTMEFDPGIRVSALAVHTWL